MEYTIKFTYLDGKDIDFVIEEQKLKGFFEKLNKGQIYWHDEKMLRGFWLNLEKVRYIEFFGLEPVNEEISHEQTENSGSSEEIPGQDGEPSIREEEACTA